MTFKEELRRKKLPSPFIYWKKKNKFYLNSCDLCENVLNQNGNLRINMNKTLGICEINLMIWVLI